MLLDLASPSRVQRRPRAGAASVSIDVPALELSNPELKLFPE